MKECLEKSKVPDTPFSLDDISSVEDGRESFSKLASNVCVREQLEITLNDCPPVPLMNS